MKNRSLFYGLLFSAFFLAALPWPAGAVAVSDGDIFAAEPSDPSPSLPVGAVGGIYHFDSTGALIAAYSGGSLEEPMGIAIDRMGDLIIGDPQAMGGGGAIFKIDLPTGTQSVVSQGGDFVDPRGVAIAPNGDIYVADPDAFGFFGGVIRVNPTTGAQTSMYSSIDINAAPIYVALEADGDILVSDIAGASKGVVRIPAGGGVGTQLASGGNISDPRGLAVADNGDIYLADNSGKIIRIDPTTGGQTLIASGAPISCPEGIAIDADGYLVIGDPCDEPGAVIRVNPADGTKTELWNAGVSPNGIAIYATPPPATTSSNPCTATPAVTLAVPNGGESFKEGDQASVFWSSAGCQISGVRLSLSTDGGLTYPIVIADNVAYQNGYYLWTVPASAVGGHDRIKAVLLGPGGASLATDESNGDFTVVGVEPPPETTVPAEEEAATPTPAETPAGPSGATAAYVPDEAAESAPTINEDLELEEVVEPEAPACVSGSLIKGSQSTVYYCGGDGQRYVFPNRQTFLSWYHDFSSVIAIDDATLATIPIGGNVTYRPGVRMVKVQTDPKVYAIARGGVLRWVPDEETAASLYGSDWATKIDDVSDAFFVNYSIGDPVSSVK